MGFFDKAKGKASEAAEKAKGAADALDEKTGGKVTEAREKAEGLADKAKEKLPTDKIPGMGDKGGGSGTEGGNEAGPGQG